LGGVCMARVTLGPNTFLFPKTAVLVGALVEGRPNFLALGQCTTVDKTPAMVAVVLDKRRYTLRGIRECGEFSINVPSVAMLALLDHCGMVSGEHADKSALFTVFFGELTRAPLIQECPLRVECRVERFVEMPTHELVVGEIIAVHADKEVVVAGLPSVEKMQPILVTAQDATYWNIGPKLGCCGQVSLAHKAEE
jgi:flavin reductase (DIM6/NTAB) family NADH-FMN oxidoreductase RutF